MDQFKLVSEFTPKGDQPEAIRRLTENVQTGKGHQVLLGVTGSGKSLDYDEPILVYKRTGGGFLPHVFPIGQLVDRRLEEQRNGQSSEQWYTLSFNPDDCSTSIRPISDYLRHDAPASVWEVLTDCGREALMTGDHNLWVLRDGRLRLIETSELEVGDYIPLPRDIPSSNDPLESLDILRLFSDDDVRFFIQAPELIERLKAIYGRNTVLKHLKALFPAGYASKLRSIEKGLKGSGFKPHDFYAFVRSIGYELLEDDINKLVLHCQGSYRLPSSIPLNDDWLRLMGWYVAEGHATDKFITLSVREEPLRKEVERSLRRLDIAFSYRQDGDYQISNKIIINLLSLLCGTNSWNKRLPSFWPQLSLRQLGALLGSYFDGDGGVEENGLVCATASRALASDLLYAFSFLGIWARCQKRFKRATNTDHFGNLYRYITVSGGENILLFRNGVSIHLGRKRSAIERILQKKAHSNVDVIPLSPVDFRALRKKCSVFTTELEGLTHSAISMYESGKRRPKRKTLEHILEKYRCGVGENGGSHKLFNEIEKLLSLRWTRVSQFGSVKYDKKYVYDLAVPGNETFFGGRGGLFVHNTFSIAHLIANVGKPTLVIAPNKTLAAQLFAEFKELFPENAVEYFVSYYDYYQPEAYLPPQDLYIEKDSSINEQIDKLRHSATHALLTRRDVIIVASVSCIYGLGSPEAYQGMLVRTKRGETLDRQELLRRLIEIQYERNDIDFHRGTFRVRGDSVEIIPAYEDAKAVRLEFFGDELERIVEIDALTGEVFAELGEVMIFPGSHFVTPEEQLQEAVRGIRAELAGRMQHFYEQNKPLERARIEQRTKFDLEMIEEMGFCKGIENYSRYLTGRAPGEPPPTLLEYFPRDFLLVIDESHITVPQIGGMFSGDRSRKTTLVEYGFRLPSALDNRPLTFDEFERLVGQAIYVSATPADYELEKATGKSVSNHESRITNHGVIEQIVRPTGLIDPEPEVRPTAGQVDDLLGEIKARAAANERVLVTTLTKRMAEELADYFRGHGVRVRYLHADVESLERMEILRALRKGGFDVLVGINLLREGLDLPEVSLVAILDADREGFLRSTRSLIQTFGRAARNVNGRVILYGDAMTDSMRRAIDETLRRRELQQEYNREHGITPQTIVKKISDVLHSIYEQDYATPADADEEIVPPAQVQRVIGKLRRQMLAAAKELDFERAAELRDRIIALEERDLGLKSGS